MFHKTLNVTHPEQLRDEWLWREAIEVGEMLSRTQENNWRLRSRDTNCNQQSSQRADQGDSRGNSPSALRMSIHLGDDDGAKVSAFLERTTLGLGGLT